ncbi:centrosomal protein of 112 kDa-like [Anneissia japonica]|uniref:centrosomal protein of 112 kDa-like n=1 Tax=Anneissia japonica TaxID=1529436 RepID=UPI0014255B00|nr:centrosomal protein of 112 kDa-like [Anneissia japonica]
MCVTSPKGFVLTKTRKCAVNALREKMSDNMAEVQKSLGRECIRQASILQDRLARRQALAVQYKSITEKEEQEMQNRIEHQYSVLSKLCEDSHLTEIQMKSIIKQYESDLSRVHENHKAEVKRQTMQLASKLEEFRCENMVKLKKKHQNEKQKLKENTIKAKAKDFVEAHHDLLGQQRNECNDYIDELDYSEAQQISGLRKQLKTNYLESIKEQETSFYETLADQARLTDDKVNKLMKKHWKNVDNFQVKKNKEKKRQLQILQEKITENKSRWIEEQERVEVAQQQLIEQQDRTVHNLLVSQSGLDEEARNQILKQHAQNMAAINNQMQMARLKQQKILDGKLARRETYLQNLKKKQEKENAIALSKGSETELEKLKRNHEAEINIELKAIEAERQQSMSLLRDRLASENKAVLKNQDAQLGLLIGKLQVGQTRRQGIIRKNNRIINELQAQLLDSVVENDVPTQVTNSIIKNHMREVEDLHEKMQEAKRKQYRILKDKVESRTIKKEKAMEYEIDVEMKRPKSDSAAA